MEPLGWMLIFAFVSGAMAFIVDYGNSLRAQRSRRA
jgi:hypothetical protein